VPTISTLGLKILHFKNIFEAAILKIQDGCQLPINLMGTTGFPVYKNISLDTKIMSLCALELKIWPLLHLRGGHFENPRWLPTADPFDGHHWIPCV